MEDQKSSPPRYTDMGPNRNRNRNKTKTNPYGTISLIVGIVSLISFCFPPVQLILGSLAVMFALLSMEGVKSNLKGQALAGALTGVLSCVLSILIFWQTMNALDLLKDDPQYISHLNKMIKGVEELFGATN